jgi:hypothetical protein
MLRQTIPPALAGLLFVAATAFGQTTTTTATMPSPQLPPIGLAATESAQVNVANTALPSPAGGAEPVCNGTIAFYGGASDGGTVIGPVTGFSLQSGQIAWAALPYATTGASGSRTVIRVAITLSPVNIMTGAGPQVAPCTLTSSLETYDTGTGVTHASVAGVTPPAFVGVLQQVKTISH